MTTPTAAPPDYAWTDITYLLHKHDVSWRYYITQGTEPDCARRRDDLHAGAQSVKTPEIWNPLPDFATVRAGRAAGQHRGRHAVLHATPTRATCPQVSWLIPSGDNSEHPPGRVSVGQDHVTRAINAIMSGKDWASTAIFLAWDDWGGFYDHVKPPRRRRRGLRAARPGTGHQPLRPAWLHRPSDPQLRRLPEVHRGRLPRRPAAGSAHRRPPRPAPRRARARADRLGNLHARLQLQPGAAAAACCCRASRPTSSLPTCSRACKQLTMMRCAATLSGRSFCPASRACMVGELAAGERAPRHGARALAATGAPAAARHAPRPGRSTRSSTS